MSNPFYTFQEFYIPARMEQEIVRYVQEGIVPDSKFLQAVIVNNLSDACAMADDENMRNLPAYPAYFYNEAPSACWGSFQKCVDWVKWKLCQKNP